MVALTKTEASSLSIREIGKSFPAPDNPFVHRLVLDGISFSLAAGELVCLIGPSGCGKSTLLRLIAGLDSADSGELLIGSQPISEPGAERGLVFQDPNLFPWLTVRRNIEAGLVARRVLREKRNEVDEFMRLVGLEAFADAYPHHLSGGHGPARCSGTRTHQSPESSPPRRTARRARCLQPHAPAGS